MSHFEPDKSNRVVPTYVLHPLKGAVWAAFWGTPVAAGVVLAINYWRIGRKAAAWKVALLGVVATFALFGFIFSIPEDVLDRIPNAVFIVPQLVLVYLFAKSLQNQLIEQHISNGGSIASAWRSVGIGVLCLLAVVSVFLGAIFLQESSLGTVVQFGNDEIYYAGEATEDDARKLAGVLKDVEFFDSAGASVRLQASSGQYTISFVLVENAWQDIQVVEAFRDIGKTLTASGFPIPLEVHLCDDSFVAREIIRIE